MSVFVQVVHVFRNWIKSRPVRIVDGDRARIREVIFIGYDDDREKGIGSSKSRIIRAFQGGRDTVEGSLVPVTGGALKGIGVEGSDNIGGAVIDDPNSGRPGDELRLFYPKLRF